MYTNILVPLAFDEGHDGKTEAALAVAAQLAGEGTRVTLLHVMEQVPGYVVNYLPADYTSQARKALEAELDGLAKGVPGGVGIVVTGHSGRTILDYAQDNDIDLIVVASHRPGMQDLLIGSTAAYIVRHAQCAVHVLR
jgi:universal stress protein F